MKVLADGGYAISDRLEIPGEGADYFVFSRGWLLEIVETFSGEFYFTSDGEDVRPTSSRFGVFYPSFSITRSYVRLFKGGVRSVGALQSLEGLPSGPLMFDTDHDDEFTSATEAIDVLARATNRRTIEINTKPSLVTIKAKRLIDENYLAHPSIARIATRISVSPEHLSRQFKLDLGLTPSQYLRKLRVADATFRLSTGEPIVDISHEVGYNDLSRFYKQFRKTTNTSPARVAIRSQSESISKNAKTGMSKVTRLIAEQRSRRVMRRLVCNRRGSGDKNLAVGETHGYDGMVIVPRSGNPSLAVGETHG